MRRGAVEDGAWRRNSREQGGLRSFGHSRTYGRSGSGSDTLSWRKDGARSAIGAAEGTEKAKEVTILSKNGIDRRKY